MHKIKCYSVRCEVLFTQEARQMCFEVVFLCLTKSIVSILINMAVNTGPHCRVHIYFVFGFPHKIYIMQCIGLWVMPKHWWPTHCLCLKCILHTHWWRTEAAAPVLLMYCYHHTACVDNVCELEHQDPGWPPMQAPSIKKPQGSLMDWFRGKGPLGLYILSVVARWPYRYIGVRFLSAQN